MVLKKICDTCDGEGTVPFVWGLQIKKKCVKAVTEQDRPWYIGITAGL
ncbi:MAG TPA: hypothetical protein VEY51_07290 [Chondromyces sp.]|nr:hypothetical protein [Chondromyces sp.]